MYVFFLILSPWTVKAVQYDSFCVVSYCWGEQEKETGSDKHVSSH